MQGPTIDPELEAKILKGPKVPTTVAVCISDGDDARLARTLRSLEHQLVPPDEVFIERRGSVAASRNLMFNESTSDIIAFLDTDQEAPPWWLFTMAAWVSSGLFDFVCGPTRPHPAPQFQSAYGPYLAEIERRHYASCESDQTAYPMGNSMWARRVLEAVRWDGDGVLFDERFVTGGEDYDINLRATRLGFQGLLVPYGWVYHDQSNLNNPLRIMQRKLRYCYGGALAQIKNGHLAARLQSPRPTIKMYPHWLELFQKVAQVVGLLRAARWMRRAHV